MSSNRLQRHFAAAAAAAVIVGAADASIVRWEADLAVPNTSAGIYLNLDSLSAFTSSDPKSTPEWHVNVWGVNTLSMYNNFGSGMLVSAESGGTGAGSLAVGTVVGEAPAQMWGAGAVTFGPNPGQWSLNASNYFGFLFVGGDFLLHYEYGCMNIGASAGVRSISFIEYESVGNQPIVVTPSPGALALLGLAGICGRRRR